LLIFEEKEKETFFIESKL